jgi:hypothetical protein
MELIRQFGENETVGEYEYIPEKHPMDIDKFLRLKASKVIFKQLKKLGSDNCYKISIELNVLFRKLLDTDITSDPWFHSEKFACIYSRWDYKQAIREACKKIYACAENFLQEGSGWVFENILKMKVIIARFKPLTGGCYSELPLKIRQKKSGSECDRL